MNRLKTLLRAECAFKPSDTLLDRFIGLGKLRKLTSADVLTEPGKVDTNVYVVKKGIVRFSDMDGERERTFGFALPGSVFYNKHSFVKGIASYYKVDVWGATEVLVISQASYRRLLTTDIEAAVWMLHYAEEELFYQEYKNRMVNNGTARERFASLLKVRPELMADVPQRILASYLGITHEYFSRLKRILTKELPLIAE